MIPRTLKRSNVALFLWERCMLFSSGREALSVIYIIPVMQMSFFFKVIRWLFKDIHLTREVPESFAVV